MLLALISLLTIASAAPIAFNCTNSTPTAGVAATQFASNTLYQNNGNQFTLYAIAKSSSLYGYEANASTNLTKIIDIRGGMITVASVVYNLTGFNATGTADVPHNWYFKLNYTTAKFAEACIPVVLTSSLISLPPSVSAPKYAITALILFTIGVLTSIFMILFTFKVYEFHKKNHDYTLIDGLFGFAIGMSAVILIIFSLFYIHTTAMSAYSFNSANIQYNVGNAIIQSLPLGQSNLFSLVAYIFIWIDIILSVMYLFLAFIVWNSGRKRKKYEEG